MTVDQVKVIREWLDILPTGPIAAWHEKTSEELVIRLPFAPPGVETELRGRRHAISVMSAVWNSQKNFRWHDVVIRSTDDPELFVTTARSEAILASGQHYANTYVMFIRVRDGKIIEHIEYFNPLPIIQSFQPQKAPG